MLRIPFAASSSHWFDHRCTLDRAGTGRQSQPGFTEWLRVFQIVSPTLTVSGSAAIVISSYIYAKRAQEYYEIAVQADARALPPQRRNPPRQPHYVVGANQNHQRQQRYKPD